nr:hypothetical protein [Cellulomonas telluris]
MSRVDDPGSWANDSLEAFLESMAAWLDDMDGYFASRGSHAPSEPTWRLIGQMALAARVYE